MSIDTSTQLEQALNKRVGEYLEGTWPEGESHAWVSAYLQGWPVAEVIRMATFPLTILCSTCKREYACTYPDDDDMILLKLETDGLCLSCGEPFGFEWPLPHQGAEEKPE